MHIPQKVCSGSPAFEPAQHHYSEVSMERWIRSTDSGKAKSSLLACLCILALHHAQHGFQQNIIDSSFGASSLQRSYAPQAVLPQQIGISQNWFGAIP